MDSTAMPEIMKMLNDKLGGDPTKINSIFSIMQGNVGPLNHSDDDPSNDTQKSDSDTSYDMPDIETIMKIKKIIDSMKTTSNDPSINLLSSLKPYMREEKKSKIDQYIKILNIGKAMSILGELGSDSK